MSGLGDLFAAEDAAAARAAGDARLTGGEFDAVHGQVRKAHARRSATRASLAALAAVVVGVSAVYVALSLGARTPVADHPVNPSLSSSPSSSASPSPNPTISGVAFPAFAGTVTVDPHLPEAQAITPEVWAAAGPGWSLISYQERWLDSAEADEHGPQVIYLASPEGGLYELTTPDGDALGVLAWEAGSETAAVSVRPEGDPPFAGLLNIVTGDVTPIDGYAPYIWSGAFLDSDGHLVFTGNDGTSAFVRIAADGIQKDYVIPAQEGAGELAKAEVGATACGVAAPFSEQSVLVTCSFDADGPPQGVFRVNALAGTVDEMFRTPEGKYFGPVTRAGDAAVGAISTSDGPGCLSIYSEMRRQGAHAVAGAVENLLPEPATFVPFGKQFDRLTWGMSSGCNGSPMVVVNSELDADAYAVLVPYPEGRPQGEHPYESVTGVAVAP